MNEIGKLNTFWQLLNEQPVIVIPKVQRDYAYGRKDDKAKEVLGELLDNMLTAVREDKTEILDFVYGGPHSDKGDKDKRGMEPLDGQQRLTTLYLLYFYASIVQEDVTEEDVEPLRKFRYETRQSATEFCESLLGPIRQSILIVKEWGSIKAFIEDHPQYITSYKSDPTISSMLNVLETIEKKFSEAPIEKIWTKLTTKKNICFYSLSLSEFGLTDDLYIKMNSRGKKLTKFEIFKADFEKVVYEIAPEQKDSISKKIDTDWMDVLWEYAISTEGSKNDVVKKADTGFMQLFSNIFRLELFVRGIEKQKNRQFSTIGEVISGKVELEGVVSYFDTIRKVKDNGGIEKNWYKYFYFSDEAVGRDDKVRLFWRQAQNRKPVFYLAMEHDLSVPELIYFYALFLVESREIEYDTALRCLRIIRNLTTANVRANSQRYSDLNGFLKDVKEIIDNDGNLTEGDHKFIGSAFKEEIVKSQKPDHSDWLLRYENHIILQGSVSLFMNKYPETEVLSSKLKHFECVFRNGYNEYFDKLRIAFLDQECDYTQYEAYMESEGNGCRRYFIHALQDFEDFFIENSYRRNQKAILDILEKKISSLEHLLEPEEKCKEFGLKSWQYYMAKYISANRQDTKYGCYAWDDRKGKPIEMIILNSSQHSSNNIEWRMLNHILISELWDDNVNYSLDPHASSPFVMNKYHISFDITQSGWKVGCEDQNLINSLERNDLYSIKLTCISDEGNYYLFDFNEQRNDLDYIDLAKVIVMNIENYYSSQQIAAM